MKKLVWGESWLFGELIGQHFLGCDLSSKGRRPIRRTVRRIIRGVVDLCQRSNVERLEAVRLRNEDFLLLVPVANSNQCEYE